VLRCILCHTLLADTTELQDQVRIAAYVDSRNVQEGIGQNKDIVDCLADGDVVRPFIPVETIMASLVIRVVKERPSQDPLSGRCAALDTALGDTRLIEIWERLLATLERFFWFGPAVLERFLQRMMENPVKHWKEVRVRLEQPVVPPENKQ
jgi:hypothetical protein